MTQTKKQITRSEVYPNLKAGDVVEFTNERNYKVVLIIFRADELSWYPITGGRNSYGTLKRYMKYKDFRITSN